MARVRILAIDPGLSRTGIALLVGEGNRVTVEKFDHYASKSPQYWGKLIDVDNHISGEFPHFYDHLVIEEPIYSWGRKNPKAFARSNMLVARMLATSEDHVPCAFLVNPKTVKMVFTGRGKADKDDIVARAQELCVGVRNIGNAKGREAVADAIGIGYTLWWYLRNPKTTRGVTPLWGKPKPLIMGE